MYWIKLRTFFICGMIGLAGSAGASVTQQAQQTPASNDHPTKEVVHPFAVDPDEVSLNSGFIQRAYRNVTATNQDETQAEIADDLSQTVCLQFAAELTDKGYNAVCLPRGTTPAGGNVIIVDGEFNNVSEGNRVSRRVIGFSVGASTLDTDVYVIQRANGMTKQLMQFSTHADSGHMPGIAVTDRRADEPYHII